MHDLAHIDCNVVAERFLKLDELEFDGNDLTNEQTTALFNQSEVRNNLKKLTVNRKWHLEHIEPTLFASFLSKIENVTVPFILNLFEKEQLEELFKTIVDDQDATMKYLDVSGSRLDIVNLNILAKGINNL